MTALLATFTDANPNASASDFAASINWGDGTPLDSNVSIVADPTGGFDVIGQDHDYLTTGTYTVGVTITDAGGSTATATSTVVIVPASGNQPPQLTVPNAMTINPGGTVSFQVTSLDPDGDTLTLSASNLPSGATFVQTPSAPGSATGTFSWTPSYGQWGNFTPTFTVNDGAGQPNSVVSANVSLTVQTPQAMLAGLVPQLEGLESRGLNAGTGNAILGNLQAAIGDLNNADLSDANAMLDVAQNLINGLQPGAMPDLTGEQLQLIQTALVGLLVLQQGGPPPLGSTLVGPNVVPGNSEYGYQVKFNGGVSFAAVPINRITCTIKDYAGNPTNTKVLVLGRLTDVPQAALATLVTGVYVIVQFPNIAVNLTIQLQYDVAGVTVVSTPIEVNVIQLTVGDVPSGLPGRPYPTLQYTAATVVKNDSRGRVTAKLTANGTDSGFSWGAEVGYMEPEVASTGAQFDISHLQVGFVMHVQPVSYTATYLDGTVLTSSIQSKASLLDSGDTSGLSPELPFVQSFSSLNRSVYTSSPAGKWSFSDTSSFIDLASTDSPTLPVPAFTGLVGLNRVIKENIVLNFVVDVVARSDEDLAGPGNNQAGLWIESSKTWSLNINVTFTSFANPITFTNAATLFSQTGWVATQGPKREATGGQTANSLLPNQTFS